MVLATNRLPGDTITAADVNGIAVQVNTDTTAIATETSRAVTAETLLTPILDVINTITTSGSAQTIPLASVKPTSIITLTANCTLTLPTPAAGESVTVVTKQDGTGGRTITWATPAGAIRWPGGATPSYTTTAGAIDVTAFSCIDGTNWYGFPAGYNLS